MDGCSQIIMTNTSYIFDYPQRMAPENDTCWQIEIDVEYYDIYIFLEIHNDFQFANCV
jgi:hypothetical protein